MTVQGPNDGAPPGHRARAAVVFSVAPWFVLLLSLVLTAGAAWYLRQDHARIAASRFEDLAAGIAQRVEARLLTSEQAVRAAASFASATAEVSDAAWDAFVNGLALQETPFEGARAIGFARRVASLELPGHVLALRRDHPGYVVWPASAGPEHFPLVRRCAIDRTPGAHPLGFDATPSSGPPRPARWRTRGSSRSGPIRTVPAMAACPAHRPW
jgi:hypothetical protein